MSNHIKWLRKGGIWLPIVAAVLVLVFPIAATATGAGEGFNVQVSPSPLTVTLNPGEQKTATLTVRNLSNHSETLIPELHGFAISANSDKIDLRADAPLGLDQWVRFSQSSLTLAAGSSQPLEIVYNTPRNVGFSYALAITLSQADRKNQVQGAALKASVAVFNLININRSDAKRELSIERFTSKKSKYEYVPASFELTIKNKGNVIDQPAGNLFIQRSFGDSKPIATIPINKANGYILPDISRTLTMEWSDGFPQRVTDESGKSRLSWNWGKLGKLRIGKYVAKAVLVYNDGQRDVPLVISTTFWVIPWKLLLGTVVVAGLVVTGLIAWVRIVMNGTKKVRKYARRK